MPRNVQNVNNYFRQGPGPLPRGRILVSHKYEELRTILTMLTIFLLPLAKILLMGILIRFTGETTCIGSDCEKAENITEAGNKNEITKSFLFTMIIRDAVLMGTVVIAAVTIYTTIVFIIYSNQENVFSHMNQFGEIYYSTFKVQYANYALALIILQLCPRVYASIFMVGMLEVVCLYFVSRVLEEQDRLVDNLQELYWEQERMVNNVGDNRNL